MKLYLISRIGGWGYSESSHCLIAAESEEDVWQLNPIGKNDMGGYSVSKSSLKIECLGESNSPEEKIIFLL